MVPGRFFKLSLCLLTVVAGLLLACSFPKPLAVAEQKEPAPALVNDWPLPNLAARAFGAFYLSADGQLTPLVGKDLKQRWPIASITKLFTASVVSRDYDLRRELTITSTDLINGDGGFLHSGDTFSVQELLFPLLIESSNSAALALAHLVGEAGFVKKMNDLAQALNLSDTALFNPNGLDPVDSGSRQANYSTADDLALLARWLIINRPELLALTRLPSAVVHQASGAFHHEAHSTDELLIGEPWSARIVGGKTGSTDLAGRNLLLILKQGNGYLISVVLGAADHFGDTRTLLNWVLSAYRF